MREAIESVIPIEKLRWVAFSHVESDECGGLNQLLAAAPNATPLCGRVAAIVSMNDLADRPPRAVGDGERFSTGKREFMWLDTPNLPHAWECGYLFESTTQTLFCGDLFTQPGADTPAVTDRDIIGPSDAFRHAMDYWAYARDTRKSFEKLIATKPQALACMHGSSWRGDGAKLLRDLAATLE